MTVPRPFHAGRIDHHLFSPVASFAAFYDAAVERRAGGRLHATDLRAAYQAWAAKAGGTDLSFKVLRRMMEERGHRHIKSNQMVFTDAALCEPRHFDLAKGVGIRDAVQAEDQILRKIDRALASLASLRDEVVAGFRTKPEGGTHVQH